jgi:hypothetical protein
MLKQLLRALRPSDPTHKATEAVLTATVSQAVQENNVASKRLDDTLTGLFDGKCPLFKVLH